MRALNVVKYVDFTAPYTRPAVTADTRHTFGSHNRRRKLGLGGARGSERCAAVRRRIR